MYPSTYKLGLGKTDLGSCLQAAGFCVNGDSVSDFITRESVSKLEVLKFLTTRCCWNWLRIVSNGKL